MSPEDEPSTRAGILRDLHESTKTALAATSAPRQAKGGNNG